MSDTNGTAGLGRVAHQQHTATTAAEVGQLYEFVLPDRCDLAGGRHVIASGATVVTASDRDTAADGPEPRPDYLCEYAMVKGNVQDVCSLKAGLQEESHRCSNQQPFNYAQ